MLIFLSFSSGSLIPLHLHPSLFVLKLLNVLTRTETPSHLSARSLAFDRGCFQTQCCLWWWRHKCYWIVPHAAEHWSASLDVFISWFLGEVTNLTLFPASSSAPSQVFNFTYLFLSSLLCFSHIFCSFPLPLRLLCAGKQDAAEQIPAEFLLLR